MCQLYYSGDVDDCKDLTVTHVTVLPYVAIVNGQTIPLD